MMCSLCGALGGGPSWEQEGVEGDDARWLLRREAAGVANELTSLFSRHRIKVAAHPDHGFIVSFATGGSAIISNLGEVWHLLERRRIEVPDPLEWE
jgi:hypothetical protein